MAPCTGLNDDRPPKTPIDELMDIAWGEVLDLQECEGFLEDGHTFWILYREGLDIRVEPMGEDSFIAMR